MRAIDKFIVHVVHNWKNELNEAYGEKAIQGFINKFKEEADDLNIKITDDQLRSYINTFDRIKEKLPSDQRDLTKWSIAKFIRLVTATKSTETAAEEIDITPDVVYHNDNNTIVIYNGSKQDNCIRYGDGEKWCITKTSFPNYRYSEYKSYPTFYLAKNNNLSDSNKLSFVAIQVRNPDTTRENDRYVYTNRNNSPYESEPMSFDQLLREVPWLNEVPNTKSVLKYIPLSSQEKITQQYGKNPITYREWTQLPYPVKEQYLVVRKRAGKLFSDIDVDTFVEKYLPKYPELAKFIAETPGVIDSVTLLKNLDKFPNQIRRSITANFQDKLPTSYLDKETIPFDVKKLLVQLNKWDLSPDERLYVNKEGDTIVKLELGDNIKIGLYQAEDDFPSVKLNKRTSKYLLDYPELDKIPLNNLLKLTNDDIVDKSLITKVLDNAKKDPNSAIIVKPVEDGDVILDSNSFSSYKIDKNGKITSIPFDNEEVQQVFTDSKDNEAFQQNALNVFKSNKIPSTIDKNALTSVINSIPYNQRIIQDGNILAVILATGDEENPFILMPSTITPEQRRTLSSYQGENWRKQINNDDLTAPQWRSYFNYLRSTNQSFSSNDLKTLLGNQGGWIMTGDSKKAFIANNPPVATNSQFKPAMSGDTALLINTANPSESFGISNNSGKLVKANVSAALSNRLTGQPQQAPGQAAAQANAVVRARRGRPAGVPNAPRPQQQAAEPAAQVAPGNVSLTTIANQYGLTPGFNTLGRNLRRFNMNGRQVPVAANRGASARNNMLRNVGRVTAVYEFGPSTVYIIQLNNGTNIASVVIQPGNNHYIITNNNSYSLGSPRELLQALQQRNLAEIHHYITNEYFGRNPTHLNEFKQLLRKHITEKRIK